MRIPALAILTIGTLMSASASAQTYDPGYPVCLQTYGRDGNSIACGYASLAQCNASASPSASSIHTLRARKLNHVIGDVATYIDVVLPSLGARSMPIPECLPNERKSSIY
jgi:hypothetical protein